MALPSRTLAFGSRSLLTAAMVISIVGVINFVGARNQGRLDLTRNKLHSLSDQTKKIVRELKTPIRAVYFAKLAAKEQVRPFLESYRSLNPEKFSLEYVDPDKQPARARQAGVSRYGTLQLIAQKATEGESLEIAAREIKIEEMTEEKITHGLIKILKASTPQICLLTGHGEKPFSGNDADSFGSLKAALNGQAYEVKEINLVTTGKLPDDCAAVLIWGPTKAFFSQELALIGGFLKAGGRLVVGVDMSFSGTDAGKDLNELLAPWGLQISRALLIDPSIRALQLDASVLIVNQFSREHPITKEFANGVAMPFSRPISLATQAGLKPEALLTTSSKAWAESSLKEIASGAVQYTPNQDTLGALNPAAVVEGRLPGANSNRNTRIVVFGSASFANNTYSRMLSNSDLLLNAMAWVVEDEGSISIRPKENEEGRLELTGRQGVFVFLLTVVALPLLVASGGIGFWAYRRKL
jgi:ABC-type uncharacterized transport system involved in gliding motility auxiliary subunit